MPTKYFWESRQAYYYKLNSEKEICKNTHEIFFLESKGDSNKAYKYKNISNNEVWQ